MTTIDRRIDALLDSPRERDLLVYFGEGKPSNLPPGLSERCAFTLDAGVSFALATGVSTPLAHAEVGDGLLHAWILGSPTHPDVPRERIAQWALNTLESGKTPSFAAVEGIFSAFILDRRQGTLQVVTDVLGLRPLYMRRDGTDVWLSTRVGSSWDAKAFPPRANMDAVRSWACFGYNATDGALLQGWRRLPAALHLRLSEDETSESVYHRFDLAPSQVDAPELTDRMIAAVERSFRNQTRGINGCKLSISGGFDSRLLAAISSRQAPPSFQVLVVNGSDNWRDRLAGESTECRLARQVCHKLSLPLKVVELEHDWLHAFGEPFLLMADGFPITKQIIALVVGSGTSAPVVNGFLGDNLMRGSWDSIDGKTELDFERSNLVCEMHRRHSQLPCYLLEEKSARDLTEWGRAFLDKAMGPYYEADRALVMLDLQMRQRFYMSNNFLQHLDQCEPVLPYATAELVELKLSIRNGGLDFDTFRDSISRNYPEIANIPHSKEIAKSNPPRFRPSSYTNRRWALQVLASLRNKDLLRGFDRRKLLPRLAAGAIDGRLEFVAQTAMRFLMLERVAARLGVVLDWGR